MYIYIIHKRVQAFSSVNDNPSHLCTSICRPLSLSLSLCSSSPSFDWMCVILMCMEYVCVHFVVFLASCTRT